MFIRRKKRLRRQAIRKFGNDTEKIDQFIDDGINLEIKKREDDKNMLEYKHINKSTKSAKKGAK